MIDEKRRVRILLVDDEPQIIAELGPFLERNGYTVVVAGDGEAALRRVTDAVPDLIVLDVAMPKLDGREVCRQLRATGNWIPIIMLTRYGEATERAMTLREGADDYLNKPFAAIELAARIEAVLRRARPGTPPLSAASRLMCGLFVLDRPARRVRRAGQDLPLSAKAVAVLDYLMTHPGEVLDRERLLDEVWDIKIATEARVVDMRIAELRKYLQDEVAMPHYIKTVPGEGYVFIGKVEAAP